QAEDGIRDFHVTGVQTCALPISLTSIRLTEAASAVSIIVICTVVAPAITKLVVIATAETADINLEAAFIGPLNLLSPLSPREKPGLRQSVQPADYRNSRIFSTRKASG